LYWRCLQRHSVDMQAESRATASGRRRLRYKDYSAPGLYFVTICSDFKGCTFGRVKQQSVVLSPLGRIVEEAWIALPRRHDDIRLHEHMVMPNHVHGIIELVSGGKALQAAPLQGEARAAVRVPLLSVVVRSFKADVTRRAGFELGWNEEIWQQNYFDRVIRDGREFSNAARYIAENPIRWTGKKLQRDENREIKRELALQAAPLQSRWRGGSLDGID
jgi:putative transposase